MQLAPHYWTTTVGSFPDHEADPLCTNLIKSLDVPAWPQLPRRSFLENMYVQFSASLPGIVLDVENERITFDTSTDLTGELEVFYDRYLREDLDGFALPEEYAAGFYAFEDHLSVQGSCNGDFNTLEPTTWVKGQVTGPISVGLTITDQDLRAGLYNEMMADVIVKNTAMHARWQAYRLKKLRPHVIIAVDEPYMASFGSAYISLSKEGVIAMLDEVFEAIHSEGALAWVHCCANTDWSVLLATQVDILNLDAYGYLENLALYPGELRAFLDRGGVVAWGIVPNNAKIFELSANDLDHKLRCGFNVIHQKAVVHGIDIPTSIWERNSMLTTSCGLGQSTLEVAVQSLLVLQELGLMING